ncbi:hypothetical protein [Aeromicrobium wangtongii]|uniref:Uncharacterized protein n=1 Tax=Aeromicrobium wangtongii TaxID=2969247 RepID=A0ABY5M913_9ACTN|nr:hypothetical protein [Aeromicrobium wangtongii]MCD9198697.1 hypothetical protein [Aeromicrobium wangtongii]MCL3819609.1 hypothetical protein [Aeromicrobium wangtongii]UUP13257.1 hypothetical protein NQV15_15585 [Aeromicrobium wangtongii]
MSQSSVRTAAVEITPELIATIVGTGGYTHPLFNPPPADAATAPLPGQGVLLMMGGLLEQSGALDHAIALVELKNVRFLKMVSAGTTVSVELVALDAHQTSSGKVIQNYRWTALDGNDVPLVEAHAVMLVNRHERTDAP